MGGRDKKVRKTYSVLDGDKHTGGYKEKKGEGK